MEFHDWDFSAEEFDSLERNALIQISERNFSSSQDSYFKKVEPSSPAAARSLPAFCSSSQPESGTTNSPKKLPKLSVKLFLHATGNIAAKFQYNPIIISVICKIPNATWHANERLWMFPLSSLSSAKKMLSEANGAIVEILDGLEKTFEVSVSQPKSSPSKQTTLDSFLLKRCHSATSHDSVSQPKSSPAKQTTPDSFLVKRGHSATSHELDDTTGPSACKYPKNCSRR